MITRKSLARLLQEAAEAQGTTLTAIYAPVDGRLAYRIGTGTAVYTPGETAERLGVRWP